ncbi:protein CHUP1, chloroplastic-like [Malania oleifera]|uniref:protein CHUP1, chloroplastic-like n=1 Tax=Malania oleifera TaxID=397392 RepID=UPI0025ADC961|nr:protein CHUP1, chloroplastic-like [Malania oleifera]
MREEKPLETRAKASKFADQNQMAKGINASGNSDSSKTETAPSWKSHIVKGFLAEKKTMAEKKTKSQATVPTRKAPLANSDATNQKNSITHLRVKRSLIGDLACSVNSTQVQQHTLYTHRIKSSGSRDLFLELENLRGLLQESKEREFKLQAELSECRKDPRVLELEGELEEKRNEVASLMQRVGLLEAEKTSLSEQLALVNSVPERPQDISKGEDNENSLVPPKQNLEMEVVELRRLNKELQLQKRDLICRLSSMESQLATPAKVGESDMISKIKAEASLLRHTNEDLCKQVEGLQMSRLNEVEELIYLRWVNLCLRNELRNSCITLNSDKTSSPSSIERTSESGNFLSCQNIESLDHSCTKSLHLIKKLKTWPKIDEDLPNSEFPDNVLDKNLVESEEGRSPTRRHSISGLKCCAEDLVLSKRRQSDGFMCPKDIEKELEPLVCQKYDFGAVEKRALRIPNPPPRPSCINLCGPKEEGSAKISLPPLPPPPPPPPPKLAKRHSIGMVQRAPQVVEFYHSLMKRDSRKDSSNGGTYDAPDVANVRSSMIGEIENRSSHLLAIKADVETQGEFVNSLIREVNDAAYQDIEDVVAFVKWLDDELCFLVDERAVLKHFDWPEKKADTLREAAFSYRDLKKLESEVSAYEDDPRVPSDIALKKMVTLSEKMERTVYNLLRTRELLMRNCKEFQIPSDWMHENGILSRIKFCSMKLAKKYMKRVAMELQSKGAMEKDATLDYMLLQGVRFAFRIHQFAGGFDAETMHAFEELRNLTNVLKK